MLIFHYIVFGVSAVSYAPELHDFCLASENRWITQYLNKMEITPPTQTLCTAIETHSPFLPHSFPFNLSTYLVVNSTKYLGA